MEYKGTIVYDVYSILGSFKIDVSYDVVGWGNDFEITRISISPHEETEDFLSFNLEAEMDDILDECIKDFTMQKEFLNLEELTRIKADLIDITEPKLACTKYDFSAN